MRDWITGSLLVVLAIAGVLCLVLWGLYLWLPGEHELKDLAAILQAVVAVTAIIYAGFAAAARLELFRDFAPHITISHEISHRATSSSYVHIAVKTTLHNTSKVRVDILDAIFRIHQIAPFTDPEVETLYSQVFENREFAEMQWPTLDEFHPAWDENELTIEPGESHHETIEFIVKTGSNTVLIYTYFRNRKYKSKRSKAPMGWGEATVYDIV